jgi:hypothetical protein
MIYRDQKYGAVHNVTIADFNGKGDILVVDGVQADGGTCVMFRTDEPHTIGEEAPELAGKSSDDFKPEIIMLFKHKESVDIVIEFLQKAKENLPS